MKYRLSLFDLINIAVMLFVIVVTLYPFYYMIIISVSGNIPIMKGEVLFWPKGFNLDMYHYLIQDGRIFTGYKNTLIYVSVGTTISLLVTSLGAYSLSKREMVWKHPIMMFVLFTMFFNGGMIPTYLVVKELGLLNSLWAMVLPSAVAVWNLIIMRTFFQGIPIELEESAKMDGMNDLSIYAKIYFPLSKPVLATIGLFYAVGIWNNFLAPLLYLRKPELFPLQVILREFVLLGQIADTEGFAAENMAFVHDSLKFATIIMSTVPILLVYPFIQKYFVKGAMIGSVKG